jgi:hypothetical protein
MKPQITYSKWIASLITQQQNPYNAGEEMMLSKSGQHSSIYEINDMKIGSTNNLIM